MVDTLSARQGVVCYISFRIEFLYCVALSKRAYCVFYSHNLAQHQQLGSGVHVN